MASDSFAADRVALFGAYRAARYCVEAPEPFELAVDQCSETLLRLLRDTGAACAALLTAFNPGSAPRTATENETAQRSLQETLDSSGWRTIPACNEDPYHQWPTEVSTLALGLPLEDARRIAAQYGQLAFLWSDATGCPRLIETSAGPANV